MKQKKTYICKACGEPIKNRNTVFCDAKCRAVVEHQGLVILICNYCGKHYKRDKHSSITSKYCSVKCKNNATKKYDYIGMSGKKYGSLLVLESREEVVNGHIVCKCKCDCGKIIKPVASHVINGFSRSCGCVAMNKIQTINNRVKMSTEQKMKRTLYTRYKGDAKTRKHSFDLPRSVFESLIIQDCFYCGAKPAQLAKIDTRVFLYNGIDRVDNTIGYTEENCVPCCGICNRMKRNLTLMEFLEHIRKINNYIGDKITIMKVS